MYGDAGRWRLCLINKDPLFLKSFIFYADLYLIIIIFSIVVEEVVVVLLAPYTTTSAPATTTTAAPAVLLFAYIMRRLLLGLNTVSGLLNRPHQRSSK